MITIISGTNRANSLTAKLLTYPHYKSKKLFYTRILNKFKYFHERGKYKNFKYH